MKKLFTIKTIVIAIIAMTSIPASAQWNPVQTGPHPSVVNSSNVTVTTNSSITDDLVITGTNDIALLPKDIIVTGSGNTGTVIQATVGGNTAIINGTLLQGADNTGIFMNGDGVVKISQGGGIYGNTGFLAINIAGAGEVDTAGTIFAPNGAGIQIVNGGSVFADSTSVIQTQGSGIFIGGTPATVTNKGAITSTGAFGIFINGLGTINNSGSVSGAAGAFEISVGGTVNNSGSANSASGFGILVGGPGTVNNSGSVLANSFGILVAGAGTINNSGAVTSIANFGLEVGGAGTINNSATVSANSFGIFVAGGGTINNSGAVTSTTNFGLLVGGPGNITNTATIQANSFGIEVAGPGSINNSGAVTSTTGFGLLVAGPGSVTNTATVQANSFGILVAGPGSINNSGAVTSTTNFGLQVAGPGNITNTATIQASNFGIQVSGPGNINNSGNVTSTGNFGLQVVGDGNIVNSGNVISPNFGIQLAGVGTVINTGNLTSTGNFGIQVVGNPNTYSAIYNEGVVHSTNFGIEIVGAGTIKNEGIVTSDNSNGIILGGIGAVYNWGTVRGGSGNAGVIMNSTAMLQNTNGGQIFGGDNDYGVIFSGSNSTLFNYNASIFNGSRFNTAFIFFAQNSNATIGNWSTIQGLMDGNNPNNNNKLHFVFTGVPQSQQNDINSYIAGHQQAGTFTLRGETYQWQNFTGTDAMLKSYAQQAKTPNQKAIGSNLDSFTRTPSMDMRTVLTSIDSNPSVPYALNQLSPQLYQLLPNIQFTGASFQSEQINGHLDNTRGTGPGGNVDTSQLNTDPTIDPQLAATHSRLLAFNDFGPINPASAALLAGVDGGKEKHVSEMPSKDRFGFFAAGSAEFAEQDSLSPADGLSQSNYTTTSALMGVDYRLTDHLVAGIMGGFGETDANLDAQGSKVHTSTSSIGAYATYFRDHWYANGIFNYGFSDYKTTRNMGFDSLARTATANTNGDQFVVNMNGGYDFHCGNWTLGPTVGIQYVDLTVDKFNEGGAGAASLNVGKQSPDSLRSSFGGRVAYNWQMEHVTVTPSAHVAWQHEILDDSRGINANFNEPGLGSFTVMTSSPERDWAYLGGGVNALLWQKVNVFIDYNAQVGQSDFFAHNVDAGARITW